MSMDDSENSIKKGDKKMDEDGLVNCNPKETSLSLSMNDHMLGSFFNTRAIRAVRKPEKDLIADLFFTLYKQSPEIVLNQKRPVNAQLLSWALKNPDIASLRDETVGCLLYSLRSAGIMFDALMLDETIQDLVEKQGDWVDEKEQSKGDFPAPGGDDNESDSDGSKDGKSEGDGEGDSSSPSDDGSDKEPEEMDWGDFPVPVEEKLDKLDKNPFTSKLGSIVNEKVGESLDELNAVAKLAGKNPKDNNVEGVNSLIELVNQDVGQIALIMGRLHGITVGSIDRAIKSEVGYMTKLGRTRDMTHVHPGELIHLSPVNPFGLRAEKVMSLISDGLTGLEVYNVGKTEGSFIAYVDESGSMSSGYPHSCVTVAKTLCASIALAAMEHGQRFDIYGFGYDIYNDDINQSTDKTEILKWANRFMNSGSTNFDLVFGHAREVVENLPENEKVDILFVTDGEDTLGESGREWLEEFKKDGGRLISVFINHYDGGEHHIKRLSSVVFNVSTANFLKDLEKIAEIVGQIIGSHMMEVVG